jgi:hypothetical protein
MKKSLPRADAVLIQAVIAGALSFAHLHDIAEAAGQTGWMAWAYPVSVDLLLVAAWRRIHACKAAGVSVAGPWFWFVIALAASLGANVATAGVMDLQAVPDWLCILVAGWPALAFFGGTLLAHSAPARKPIPEPAETPAPADQAPDAAPAVVTVDRAAPSKPAVTPSGAPGLPPSPKPPMAVPPALVEHARKISSAHCSQTGEPMGADALAARLGIPAPMANELIRRIDET